jgi:formate hydrogenlyase transcriptional activator
VLDLPQHQKAEASVIVESPPPSVLPTPSAVQTLEALDRDHIRPVLALTTGRIYGKAGAAELLGLKPSTLQSRMKKLGIGGKEVVG